MEFEKNDIDYLLQQPWVKSKEQAYQILSKEEKYTKPADPAKLAEQRQRNISERQKEESKPKRRGGLLGAVTESLGGIFRSVGGIFGGKPQPKTTAIPATVLTTFPTGQTAQAPSTPPSKKLTDHKAPNGLYYEQNDVDYLVQQQGMTEEQAYEVLSKEDKYTKEVPKEQIEKQEREKKAAVLPQQRQAQRQVKPPKPAKAPQSATPEGYTQRISQSVVRGQAKAKAVNDATQNGTKIDKVVDTESKPGEVSTVAPNGSSYEENDIKYLMNQGYSREDALTTLSRAPKYAKKQPQSPVEAQLQNQAHAKEETVKKLEEARTSPTSGGEASSALSEKVDALLNEQKQTNKLLEAILNAIVSNGQAVANAMASKPEQSSTPSTNPSDNPYVVAAGAKSILDASLLSRSGTPGYMTSVMGNHSGSILSFLDVASRPG